MDEVKQSSSNEAIYMSLDLHRKSWHLTIRTQRKMSLQPQWRALHRDAAILDAAGER
jgi:hypothetical protein